MGRSGLHRSSHVSRSPTKKQRGPAPVSRILAATTNSAFDANAHHYTAGCHGTSGFLNSILRVLNIPVDTNVNSGHSLTRFMTDAVGNL